MICPVLSRLRIRPALVAGLIFNLLACVTFARTSIELAQGWRSLAADTGTAPPTGFTTADFDDSKWTTVAVPHNWDTYEGFRQLKHGDRHGSAWYRRSFTIDPSARDQRIFLFFEGVGSYATVWLNGQLVGRHGGGLTTFTLDITTAARIGQPNLLVVQADHPNGIRDLPWVCGGSERAYGFSEGTQPFGIFRPVHLVTTAPVRVAPFGVHAWNDADANATSARVHLRTEVTNYDPAARTVTVVNQLRDRDGTVATTLSDDVTIAPGATITVSQDPAPLRNVRLWSLSDPHLYTIETSIIANGADLDRTATTFGIRTVRWPTADGRDGRFYLNGEPVFINGTCDYEHLLGASHAFSDAQIDARVNQIEAGGYNAFRDAHHPHNLRFNTRWDRDGLLWWTQFGAHIWFDNDDFRANFKALLRDWVRERRNSPSLVLWGLQNESQLPADFAAECTAIIRELDPTSPSQRLVTTCNGGRGTDWDVPQNWTGTYGGDPETYADDLRTHRLFGEYGAWRSLGLHREGGFVTKGPLSEDRMTALMETKVRLGEAASAESAGHFHWPFTTHMNPGRHFGENGEQLFDGIRPLDHIGPANNKGVFTIWGEPTDAFYMFRANFAPAASDPMVYLPMHTWPGRWTEPGRKSGIIVYSNCDEVELFNGAGETRVSLGVRPRGPRGTHFTWDDVLVTTNLLTAEGRMGDLIVACDTVRLHHLPEAVALPTDAVSAPAPSPSPALYRVNCGGPDYRDQAGNLWTADRDYTAGDSWGSISWAADYPNLAPRFGSQRKIYDPIADTADDDLYRTFRYGRDRLAYHFAVPNGDYTVELHFIEPWYGLGGGSAAGWRQFDVALNGTTNLHNLDLWSEVGPTAATVKHLPVSVRDGQITITFPRVAAGQAVISAIAITSPHPATVIPPAPVPLIHDLKSFEQSAHRRGGLDEGDQVFSTTAGTFTSVPSILLDADWIQTAAPRPVDAFEFTLAMAAEVYAGTRPEADDTWENSTLTLETTVENRTNIPLWRKSFAAGSTVRIEPTHATDTALVVVIPIRPAAPSEFVALSADAATDWQAVGHAQSGMTVRTDGGRAIISMPQNLSDGDLLRAQSANSNTALTFVATDHVEVHLAYLGETAPTWWNGLVDSRQKVVISEIGPRALRKQRLAPGETWSLIDDSTDHDGFIGLVRAVRAPIDCATTDATLGGHARRVTAESGENISLPGGPDDSVTWTVELGVGDRYGLNLRYLPLSSPVEGVVQILDSNGKLLREDPISFAATEAYDSWQILRTRTGSSLNAGTYGFRIKIIGSVPLLLGSFQVE